MKTKLEMAHEWYLKQLEVHEIASVHGAWQYADAMQAEADKRDKEEASQKRKAIREMMNADNTFLEKEGQHFDDVEERQPDWSQAPNGYNYWVATSDRDGKITGGWFYDVEPEFGDGKGVSIYYSPNGNCVLTESFGYTGDWRDSLRKRPN